MTKTVWKKITNTHVYKNTPKMFSMGLDESRECHLRLPESQNSSNNLRNPISVLDGGFDTPLGGWFSPLTCDTDFRTGCQGFSAGTHSSWAKVHSPALLKCQNSHSYNSTEG